MSYGLRHELFFSDLTGRKLKLEIHKKNYFGSASSLVGTAQPVIIEWNGDDDIYSPIIGSRCIINLFVTNDTDYDEFYDADEREYLVRVLMADAFGADISWDSKEAKFDLADTEWDADLGTFEYYAEIWSGFIVVDRFREQMISKPYQISLEAIDGLGTLDGFKCPINLEETTAVYTQDLFWYLKEILKLTGHSHNILVANDIRKVGGNSDDTIFHDIVVNEYALFTSNLIERNAKEVLKEILSITNSRIYHNYGAWYIVNASALIDKDIDQLSLAPSDDDTSIEPDVIDPFTNTDAPNVEINGGVSTVTATENSVFNLFATNTGGQITSWTFSFSDSTPDISGTTSYPVTQVQAVSSLDGVTVTLTATNAFGSSVDTATLDVVTPSTPAQGDQGGQIKVVANTGSLSRASLSPASGIYNFSADQVGDQFSIKFRITPQSGFQIDSLSDFTIQNVSSYSVNITKTLVSVTGGDGNPFNVVEFVVSGTIPSGGRTISIDVSGAGVPKTYTQTVELTNKIANATIYQHDTGTPDIKTSTNVKAGNVYSRHFFRIDADSGYTFGDVSDYSFVQTSLDLIHSFQITKNGDNQLYINTTHKVNYRNQSLSLIFGKKITGDETDTTEIDLDDGQTVIVTNPDDGVSQTTSNATKLNDGYQIFDITLASSAQNVGYHMAYFISFGANGQSGNLYTFSEGQQLFDGTYTIEFVYSGGQSGWAFAQTTNVKSSDAAYHFIAYDSSRGNDALGKTFNGNEYNIIFGTLSQNLSVNDRSVSVRFKAGGAVLDIFNLTQKGLN